MKRKIRAAALSVLFVLSACGGGSGSHHASSAAPTPCPILADASAVLGHGATGFSVQDDGAALSCEWTSADGLIDAGLITYDAHAAVAAPAHFQMLVDDWQKDPFGTAEELSGIGDSAAMVANMSGGQTQIVIRKGDALAVLLVSSGDPHHDAEHFAKAFAGAVVAVWPQTQ